VFQNFCIVINAKSDTTTTTTTTTTTNNNNMLLSSSSLRRLFRNRVHVGHLLGCTWHRNSPLHPQAYSLLPRFHTQLRIAFPFSNSDLPTVGTPGFQRATPLIYAPEILENDILSNFPVHTSQWASIRYLY
jgi:hypothetical protein